MHVGQQFADVDRLGGELDALGVAEAEVDRRPAPAGCVRLLELAPVADDLVEAVLALFPLVVVGSLDGLPPVVGRPGILPAVFEDLGQLRESRGSGRLVRRRLQRERLLVELDEVVLVGQLEPLDAGGQPGDGFVFAERVEGPGWGHFVFVVGRVAEQGNRLAGHRLHAELRPEELRRAISSSARFCGSHSAIVASAQRQRWPSLSAASQPGGFS